MKQSSVFRHIGSVMNILQRMLNHILTNMLSLNVFVVASLEVLVLFYHGGQLRHIARVLTSSIEVVIMSAVDKV